MSNEWTSLSMIVALVTLFWQVIAFAFQDKEKSKKILFGLRYYLGTLAVIMVLWSARERFFSLSAEEYCKRGLTEAKSLNAQGALWYFNKAIEKDPKYITAYLYRSGIYAARTDWNKVKTDLTTARDLGGEKDPEYWCTLAGIDLMFGSPDKARQKIDKALTIDPVYGKALAYRVLLHLMNNEIDEMYGVLGKLSQSKEYQWACASYYGMYYFLKQNYSQALPYFDSAIDSYDGNFENMFAYLWCVWNRMSIYLIRKDYPKVSTTVTGCFLWRTSGNGKKSISKPVSHGETAMTTLFQYAKQLICFAFRIFLKLLEIIVFVGEKVGEKSQEVTQNSIKKEESSFQEVLDGVNLIHSGKIVEGRMKLTMAEKKNPKAGEMYRQIEQWYLDFPDSKDDDKKESGK